ncbi:hypothetical protein [Phenylobacterium sp. J367]|uniref:hypothetical protein n=1 Tax=Phenylobacterium sp. J367 TaxID=2898435 RepID=UPI00215086DB|nr:hypothetical protein [Phenylobacterium sp. J367]MCR5877866.1 hypothetical protein [Phenylobacterium sp. J367]
MPVQSTFLRRVIAFDAVTCVAAGALMTFAAEPLAALTGLSADLTRPAGIFLLAWAAVLACAASRPALPRAVVWTIIAMNLAWVAESALLLLLGWASPTALGYGFVVVQALAVAVIADLQYVGLKRAAAVPRLTPSGRVPQKWKPVLRSERAPTLNI